MSKAQSELRTLLDAVVPHRDAVEQHPLYVELTSLERIHAFMEHHVFAVWDFMCLLKALQRRLTCPTVPWLPVGDPQTRRLINEIVLSEESDELPDGRVLSHFELYLAAMSESGADFSAVAAFERRLKQGRPVRVALREVGVPAAAQEFVLETLDVVEQDQPHLIAAVFTIGREQMIPGMFVQIVRALADAHPGRLETFKLYLERHIELDRSEHARSPLKCCKTYVAAIAQGGKKRRVQQSPRSRAEGVSGTRCWRKWQPSDQSPLSAQQVEHLIDERMVPLLGLVRWRPAPFAAHTSD